MKTVSSYALDLICLTPNIKPGDPIKIEIFIVGKGSSSHNKLIINYPISLIDEKDPGFIEHCIGIYPNGSPLTGEPYLEKQGEKARDKLTRDGVYYAFNKGNFLENTSDHTLASDSTKIIPRLLAELRHDHIPPVFLKVNTSSTALSGDYDINFNFTYTDGNDIYLDKKTVKIHLKSKKEIHGLKISIIGIIIALLGAPIIKYLFDVWYDIIMNVITRLTSS